MTDLPIVVLGSGDAALSILEIAERAGREVAMVVDLRGGRPTATTLGGVPMVGSLDEVKQPHRFGFLVAAGDGAGRVRIAERLRDRVVSSRLATLVAPEAHVARTAEIGPGSVIGWNCYVGPGSRVGALTLMTDAVLGHEDVLGEAVTLALGVRVAGRVGLGSRVHIGLNAAIREGVRIGEDTIVGAMSFVNSDLPSGIIAHGIPARVVRERDRDGTAFRSAPTAP